MFTPWDVTACSLKASEEAIGNNCAHRAAAGQSSRVLSAAMTDTDERQRGGRKVSFRLTLPGESS